MQRLQNARKAAKPVEELRAPGFEVSAPSFDESPVEEKKDQTEPDPSYDDPSFETATYSDGSDDETPTQTRTYSYGTDITPSQARSLESDYEDHNPWHATGFLHDNIIRSASSDTSEPTRSPQNPIDRAIDNSAAAATMLVEALVPPNLVYSDEEAPTQTFSEDSNGSHGRAPGYAKLFGPQPSNDEDEVVRHIFSQESIAEDHLQDIERTLLTAQDAWVSAQPSSSVAPTVRKVKSPRRVVAQTFHENAAEAVAALLTPRGNDLQSCPSEVSSSFARPTPDADLLSPDTKHLLENLKDHMHAPSPTLSDLLVAIASEDTRRKNACGTLQVMTQTNRVEIAWTEGVLPALVSAIADSEGEAQLRAIACLQNLATPKENRVLVFHTADLMQTLMKIIAESEDEEARKGCSSVLAFLAKTVENRLVMAQIPGLTESMVEVIKPKPPQVIHPETWASESYDTEDIDTDVGKSFVSSGSQLSPVPSSYSRTDAEGDDEEDPVDDEDSDCTTPRRTRSPIELMGYDETANDTLRESRQFLFAVLNHLMKEKDNAYFLARDELLVTTLVDISKYQESPSHMIAIRLVATMTRHRLNTRPLVFQYKAVVPALVEATLSANEEARMYACYAIQNMAQDKSCRQELATANNLIAALCSRARHGKSERLAAIESLKNLCDEPANLIPMTNTPDCVATLMHLAHGKETSVTELMQFRACDALATLSHWLRKIATSGQSLEMNRQGKPTPRGLFVPSLRVESWNQWK